MEKTIKAVRLTVEDAQTILNYLAGKPYAEVVELIKLIQTSEQLYEEMNDSIQPTLKTELYGT